MYVPSKHHWGEVKHLLRYLNGTRSLCVWLLTYTPLTLHDFYDAYWVDNLNDCTSIKVFLIFLSANPISWSSTKQCIVASSSTKAGYLAIVVVVTELQWVKSLLSELIATMQLPPTLFSNNLGATYHSANPVFHSHIKHLAIDYHFVLTWFSHVSCVLFMSPLVTNLLMFLLNLYLDLAFFSLCNKIGVIYGTPS